VSVPVVEPRVSGYSPFDTVAPIEAAGIVVPLVDVTQACGTLGVMFGYDLPPNEAALTSENVELFRARIGRVESSASRTMTVI
jgi:hypothetical protein